MLFATWHDKTRRTMRCLRTTKSDIWSLCLHRSRDQTVYSVSVPFRLPHRFIDFVVQYSMFSLDSDASVMRVMRALFIDSFIAVLWCPRYSIVFLGPMWSHVVLCGPMWYALPVLSSLCPRVPHLLSKRHWGRALLLLGSMSAHVHTCLHKARIRAEVTKRRQGKQKAEEKWGKQKNELREIIDIHTIS